jgi:hypothetical protein
MADMFDAIENAWQDATKYPGPDIDKASFIWGFERGADYSKGIFAWHHGSKKPLPPIGKKVIVYYKDADGVYCSHTSCLTNHGWLGVPAYVMDDLMWCNPPQ